MLCKSTESDGITDSFQDLNDCFGLIVAYCTGGAYGSAHRPNRPITEAQKSSELKFLLARTTPSKFKEIVSRYVRRCIFAHINLGAQQRWADDGKFILTENRRYELTLGTDGRVMGAGMDVKLTLVPATVLFATFTGNGGRVGASMQSCATPEQ